MNKLWFLGGSVAMATVALIGIKVASAALNPTPEKTNAVQTKTACGCGGQTANCQGGCNMGEGKTCGCHGGKTGGSCGQN